MYVGCSEAVPVFQALITGVPEYELAVENAQFGLELCGQRIGADEATATPSP